MELRVLEATVERVGKGEIVIVLKEVDFVGGVQCW